MAVGGDVEGGEALGERPPQGAALPRIAPAGLIDAEDRGVLDRLAQLGVRIREGAGGPLADRVHRADRDLAAEQLCAELGCIAARDPVAHRQQGDRRLQAGAEGT